MTENGRISCYVRYDNSQYLDFRGVSADSITQEFVIGNTLIPDILSELDNVNVSEPLPEGSKSRRESSKEKRQETVAYVKCEIDENLYMPPKSEEIPTLVYGRNITFIPNFSPPEFIEGVDDKGCKTYTCIQPYAEPIFAPSNEGEIYSSSVGYERVLPPEIIRYSGIEYKVPRVFGKPDRLMQGGGMDTTEFGFAKTDGHVRRYNKEQDSFIIDTEEQNLDSDHVYALVTVPGRVTPNVTQRHMDADFYSTETVSIKNALTQDVVRGPQGFEKPSELVSLVLKI